MNIFTFYWKDGEKNIFCGDSDMDALYKAQKLRGFKEVPQHCVKDSSEYYIWVEGLGWVKGDPEDIINCTHDSIRLATKRLNQCVYRLVEVWTTRPPQ